MAKKPKRDDEREERITMEIIVDCYDSQERAMGWYYYLQDTLRFPFTATCIAKRAVSPLRVKDEGGQISSRLLCVRLANWVVARASGSRRW